MKKDLALSLLVFCLTLILNFTMEHVENYTDAENMQVEKTAYKANEMIQDNFSSGGGESVLGK